MNRGWTEKHIEELVKKYAKGGGGSDIAHFESMFVFDDDTGETVWWADNGIPDIIKQYYENDKTYRLDGCWWIGSSGHNNDYFNTSRNVTINGKLYEDLTYEAYWHFNYFELPQSIYELLIRHTDHNPMAIYNPRYGAHENIQVIYPIFVSEYNEDIGEEIIHPCKLYFDVITPYGGTHPYTHDVHNTIASIQQDTSDTACHFYDKFITDEALKEERFNYLKAPMSRRNIMGIYILERKLY